MLAKRLINQLSVSDDHEKLFVTKLKVNDDMFFDNKFNFFSLLANMWYGIYIEIRTNDSGYEY
jgi:hypothetical protein